MISADSKNAANAVVEENATKKEVANGRGTLGKREMRDFRGSRATGGNQGASKSFKGFTNFILSRVSCIVWLKVQPNVVNYVDGFVGIV